MLMRCLMEVCTFRLLFWLCFYYIGLLSATKLKSNVPTCLNLLLKVLIKIEVQGCEPVCCIHLVCDMTGTRFGSSGDYLRVQSLEGPSAAGGSLLAPVCQRLVNN